LNADMNLARTGFHKWSSTWCLETGCGTVRHVDAPDSVDGFVEKLRIPGKVGTGQHGWGNDWRKRRGEGIGPEGRVSERTGHLEIIHYEYAYVEVPCGTGHPLTEIFSSAVMSMTVFMQSDDTVIVVCSR